MAKELGKEVYRDGDYFILETKAKEEDNYWYNRPIVLKDTEGKSADLKIGDPVYTVGWWDPETKMGGSFGALDLKTAKLKLKETKKKPNQDLKVQYKGKDVLLRSSLAPDSATEIDPEIKNVILELNSKGYITNASCAGHGRSYKEYPGWIAFNPDLTRSEISDIQSIMKSFGLEVGSSKIKSTPGATYILFNPVGKKIGKKDLRLYKEMMKYNRDLA